MWFLQYFSTDTTDYKEGQRSTKILSRYEYIKV